MIQGGLDGYDARDESFGLAEAVGGCAAVSSRARGRTRSSYLGRACVGSFDVAVTDKAVLLARGLGQGGQ